MPREAFKSPEYLARQQGFALQRIATTSSSTEDAILDRLSALEARCDALETTIADHESRLIALETA